MRRILIVNKLTRRTNVTKFVAWLGDKNQYMSDKFFLLHISSDMLLKKTLWSLFMDGVQLPQGWSHFEEAVYLMRLGA